MMNGRASVDRLGGRRARCRSCRRRPLALLADAAGEVALGIDVDEQHALSGERQRGREVDGGRGFADAALLIGDGDDAGHIGHVN